MCGICGRLELEQGAKVSRRLIDEMMGSLHHRGPDGNGVYLSGPVGLGHNRLSIIDLQSGGQPISNEDNSVWIVYNGEIYNFQELREDLIARGHQFKSTSDTEVIIHLYEEFDLQCLTKLRGMFAFALWDEKRRRLFLARDRVGIKPLYYFQSQKAFSFASEIKSLLQDPTCPRTVNLHAIDAFLMHGYLPGRETLIKGVFRLEPGHFIVVEKGAVTRKQYWDLGFGPSDSSQTLNQAGAELSELLRKTVAEHLISDVPVGVLLSGGVDSTAVLSYATRENARQLQTFTVGFDGEGVVDERPFARIAANRFGALHHEISISSKEFWDFLPRYVWHMEDPVCEPPAVALYFVSKLASGQVKVLLSGEGGDEAFGGYQNYRNLLLAGRAGRCLGPARAGAARMVEGLSRWGSFRRFAKYVPAMTQPLSAFYRGRTRYGEETLWRDGLYREDLDRQLAEGSGVETEFEAIFRKVQNEHPLNQMLYVDTKTWLPDDLLLKADKITMASSVELRVPFLDHTILEFAAGLPAHFKVKGFSMKRVLKRALQGSVPPETLHRRKAGFPVPYAKWMKNEVNGQLKDILLSQASLDRGYFKRNGLERVLSAFADTGAFAKEVFSLLTLELWHDQFADGPIQKGMERLE